MRHAIVLLAFALVGSRHALAAEDTPERICAELASDSPPRLASLCTARARARAPDVESWDAAILALHRRLADIAPQTDADRGDAVPSASTAARAQSVAEAGPARASSVEPFSLPATKLPVVEVPALERWIETRCDFAESIWCKLEPSVSFAEVMWPEPVPGDPRNVPPTSLFWSFSTMTSDGRRAYLYGGGHAAYDGNEVYEFDFATLEWRRLSDPEPLTGEWLAQYYPELKGRSCLWPDNGLAAGHTFGRSVLYDNQIHVWPSAFSCGKWGDVGFQVYGIYDIASGKWIHRSPVSEDWKGSVMAGAGVVSLSPHRDGHAIVVGAGRRPGVAEVRLGTNEVVREGAQANPTGWQSSAVGITVGDAVFVTDEEGIFRVTLDGFEKMSALPADLEPNDSMRYDGKRFVFWNSEKRLYATSNFKEWQSYLPDRGPPDINNSYNRFFYIPAVDVFVAFARHDHIWIAKLPEKEVSPRARLESEGFTCADGVAGWVCPRLQSLIAGGGEVTLPKGIYRQCATVKAPLILDGNGSHIRGVACARKAALITDADTQIRNLTCSEIRVGDGNGACVRQQAASLELDNVVFRDSQSGVLTSPAARRLIVRNSVFSGLGGDCAIKCGRAHGIYFVAPAGQLVIENSRFEKPHHQGHLIKSGAAETLIVNSTLDEIGGEGSRIVDVFNGGELIIRETEIRNARGGNTEVIGYDYEGRAEHPVNRIQLERLTGSCAGGRLIGGRNSLADAEITQRDNGLADCR